MVVPNLSTIDGGNGGLPASVAAVQTACVRRSPRNERRGSSFVQSRLGRTRAGPADMPRVCGPEAERNGTTGIHGWAAFLALPGRADEAKTAPRFAQGARRLLRVHPTPRCWRIPNSEVPTLDPHHTCGYPSYPLCGCTEAVASNLVCSVDAVSHHPTI